MDHPEAVHPPRVTGILGVIPARGDSKRIPRKNIRELCGRPLMAYTIEAALQSGIFARVVVSTDNEEIARLARSLRRRGSVPPRSAAGR